MSGEPSFYELWLDAVERHLATMMPTYLVDDLPDLPWRQWFHEQVPAKDAARRAFSIAH